MPLTHKALAPLSLLLMVTILVSIRITPNLSTAPGAYLHFISSSRYPAGLAPEPEDPGWNLSSATSPLGDPRVI